MGGSGDAARVTLVAATDADFAWMIRGAGVSERGLTLPPGGVDDAGHLEMLRGIARRLRADGIPLWMMVAGDEVVGLCSYKHAPTDDGRVEIGYSVAAARRRRGYASHAIAALLDTARTDPAVRTVLAETLVDNVASHRVLVKNGFRRSGTRTDPVDGDLILWRIDLAAESFAVIRGKLTTLRPVSREDLPLLERWFTDPEIFRYWGGVAKSREAIAAECLGIQSGEEIVLSFIVERNGEPIGYIQGWSDDPLIGGIDLVLVPHARNRGYGPDAVHALALHLRDDLHWTEITVDPLVDNARAIRAFEKAGFVRDHEAPDHSDGPSLIMTFEPNAATKPGPDPAGPESTSVDRAGD